MTTNTTKENTMTANLLEALVVELEREGHAAQRRADDLFERLNDDDELLTDERYSTLAAQAGRDRGIQDAHANIVGRLRAVLIAPLSEVVDTGTLYDVVLERFQDAGWVGGSTPRSHGPAQAARLVVELVDGMNIGGGR